MSGIRTTANLLSSSLERMIAIQADAYPDGWSEEDKREAAMMHRGFTKQEKETPND